MGAEFIVFCFYFNSFIYEWKFRVERKVRLDFGVGWVVGRVIVWMGLLDFKV